MKYKTTCLVLLTKVLLSDSISPHTGGSAVQKFFLLASSELNADGSWKKLSSKIAGTDTVAVLDDGPSFQIVGTPSEYGEVYSGVFNEGTKLHEVVVKLSPSAFEFRGETYKYAHPTSNKPPQVFIPISAGSPLVRDSEDGFVIYRNGNEAKLIYPKSSGWINQTPFVCQGTSGAPGKLAYVASENSDGPWQVRGRWNDINEEQLIFLDLGYMSSMPLSVPASLYEAYRDQVMELGFIDGISIRKQPCNDYGQIIAALPPLTLHLGNGIEVSVTPDKFIRRVAIGQVSRCTLNLQRLGSSPISVLSSFDLLGTRESIHFTKDNRIGFCQPQ